jgi:hypothetical protein
MVLTVMAMMAVARMIMVVMVLALEVVVVASTVIPLEIGHTHIHHPDPASSLLSPLPSTQPLASNLLLLSPNTTSYMIEVYTPSYFPTSPFPKPNSPIAIPSHLPH